jgi:hypothetical protein
MASKMRFSVVCILGKRISVTEDYWQKIITIKHPSMAGKDAEVQRTLIDADEVRESRSDSLVRLYYRQYSSLHLCVVVKHLNGSGFIVTTYFTDRIKEGITLWIKS